MKNQSRYAIVIPVYKSALSENEMKAIKQCVSVFKAREIVLVAPENLDLKRYMEYKSDFKVKRFDDHFFKNIDGYNKLLLSNHFYKQFSEYNYILIHQLDAYVFKDELDAWCKKGYDYIGSPILEDSFVNAWLKHLKRRNLMIKLGIIKNENVGNGGFSLRKVSSFIFNSSFFKNEIGRWTLNEDLFWSFRIPVVNPFFRIPDEKIAVQFSFEKNPSYCYGLNKNKLPFGCHAWDKYDPEFWRPYII
jgi:hypothetical protein